MALNQLPTETIWIIASCFCKQGDIYALIRTNRHLHGTLIKFLYCFHGQYKHGIGLSFVAERNLVPQVRGLLDGLNTARYYRRSSDAVTFAAEDKLPKICEDEDEMTVSSTVQYIWRQTDPYSRDIYTHPLLQQGYSVLSVVNIQHALVVAIQGGHTEVMVILLGFGAQVNFYCRTRADDLNPKHNVYGWHRQGVDYPPLFTALQIGNLELVKLLLRRGADPELYTPSLLYRAVKAGRRDIIPILLEYGVGPQETALKLAVLNEDESMVRLLLDQGFNVSQYGHTGLFTAEQKCLRDIVNLLKSRGATLTALSHHDRLIWAQEDGDGTGSPYGQPTCVGWGDEVDESDVEPDDEPEEN
ncbi:hypothetical protein ACN42_g6285 [Penicillium freii]|uniref:Uncharacterized protein n=1 Tax=Penicillium freii TaxID=48697 RepID=A0A101MHS1_PENFR|nr:hypothetical protein ACN42_g6285 [Penicillium freii]